MRTKTLILSALLGLASIAPSFAQTNVYSLNAVGYINVTCPPGFAMIANQLNATNTTLDVLLGSVPDGCQCFIFSNGVYSTYTMDGGWQPNGFSKLDPGLGCFFKNPYGSNIVVTFVGEVPQGSLTNSMPAGFAIRSSIVPQAGDVVTLLGIPANDGDQIFKYNPGPTPGYSTFTWDTDSYQPVNPSMGVGEAFFVKNGVQKNWIRTFSVNN
jgi:hypothetical protein